MPKIVKTDAAPSKVDALFESAQEKINERITKEAESKIVDKLEELTKAKKVVSNIEREIESLKLQIKADLGE